MIVNIVTTNANSISNQKNNSAFAILKNENKNRFILVIAITINIECCWLCSCVNGGVPTK